MEVGGRDGIQAEGGNYRQPRGDHVMIISANDVGFASFFNLRLLNPEMASSGELTCSTTSQSMHGIIAKPTRAECLWLWV